LTIRYGYSDDGYVNKVTGKYDFGDNKTEFVIAKNIRFDPLSSKLTSLKYGNGLKKTIAYNSNGQIQKISVSKNNNELDYSIISRDEKGLVTSIDRLDAIKNQSFSYDRLGRVLTENRGADTATLKSVNYEYDITGNRTSRDDGNSSQSYSYKSNSNKLDKIDQKSVSYDARGNIISDKNEKRQFDYDVTNRMVSFHKNGKLRAMYEYNAFGQRISKTLHRTANSKDTYRSLHFAYSPEGLLLSESGKAENKSKTFARDYVWLGNRPLAQIERKIGQDGITRNAKVSYLHTDYLGTPRSASDSNGNIVWNWNSDAFGLGDAERDADGNGKKTIIRLRFAGQYYDRESGLFYNNNRDYDPKLGRYIQSDPIGLLGGQNRYAYAYNNPINLTDPTGLAVCYAAYENIDANGTSTISYEAGGSDCGTNTGAFGGGDNVGSANDGTAGQGFNPNAGAPIQYAQLDGTNCKKVEGLELDPASTQVIKNILKVPNDAALIQRMLAFGFLVTEVPTSGSDAAGLLVTMPQIDTWSLFGSGLESVNSLARTRIEQAAGYMVTEYSPPQNAQDRKHEEFWKGIYYGCLTR